MNYTQICFIFMFQAAMKENLEKIELVKDILSDKIPPAVIKK